MARPRRVVAGGRARVEGLEARTLLSSDPISPDHALWLVRPGSPVVDGFLDDEAWLGSSVVERAQAHRDWRVEVLFVHDARGLSFAARVDDEHLWADGAGHGTGHRWELEDDDSITIYIDPDASRDEYFSPTDRALGFNLGARDAEIHGSGAVRRAKFVRGDGAGGAPDVLPGGTIPDGVEYATRVLGSINDDSDLDAGWTAEGFIPWSVLGIDAPAPGGMIGLTFDVIFDNDAGRRNFVDTRGGPDRFTLPAYVDDHVQGAPSSHTDSQAGLRGPVNYADAMLVDPASPYAIAPVDGVRAERVSTHAATLAFGAPHATPDGRGRAWKYEVRLGPTPITTEAAWNDAEVFEQAYVPRGPGLDESIRLVGLVPGRAYHASVRSVDAFGNRSPLSASVAFTTDPSTSLSDGTRVVVSPLGSGLVHENGRPFVPIGDHLGLSWGYTRSLFPGDIWDAGAGTAHNFHDQPSYEGPPAPYFFQLQARGVNTMRGFLEFLGPDQAGNPDSPNGSYWLEHPAGVFNPDMRTFLHTLLEYAARYDLHLILSPFDTFLYDDAFESLSAFSSTNAGPLDDIDAFFQTPGTLEMAKRRMDVLTSWVRESPYADRVLAWEVVNEWDSWEWTLSPDFADARPREMRMRAEWIGELARHVRAIDPDRLVANPSVSRDPRGPAARIAFHSRDFDLQLPHFYTSASEEPVNNPAGDRRLLASAQHANLSRYWLTHRADSRPVLDGEWGFTRGSWPGSGTPAHSSAFTLDEDEALYRSILWTSLASGQAGGGLRIATDELQPWYHSLTPGMRRTQQGASLIVERGSESWNGGAGFDWTRARHRLDAESPDALVFASGGPNQGLAYVLRDSTLAPASAATLTIGGLARDRFFSAQLWDPGEASVSPLATLNDLYSGDGTLSIALGSLEREVVVIFVAGADAAAAERASISAIDTPDGTAAAFITGDGRLAFDPDADGPLHAIDLSARLGLARAIVDLDVFATPDGRLNLAALDDAHEVWRVVREGDVWSAANLTLAAGAPGFAGALGVFQPSWGAIHVAGLDSRGHVVNVWWTPETGRWIHNDLTEQLDAPALVELDAFVTPWDGLNLAGLDLAGNVIMYWWSPALGPGAWQWQDLTADFSGPRLTTGLDAFATPWGGLNVAGVTHEGALAAYWWAPGLDAEPHRWRVDDVSAAAGAPVLRPGVRFVMGDVRTIVGFSVASGTDPALVRFRWTADDSRWRATTLGGFEGSVADGTLTPSGLWGLGDAPVHAA